MFGIIFRGVILGALYTMASVGLSLQWGVLKNLNFSHGACITLGAYIMWYLMSGANIAYGLAFILTLVFLFVVGIAIEKTTIRPFFGKPSVEINIFIGTVALSVVLEQLYLIIFGGRTWSLKPLYSGVLKAGPFIAEYHELFVLITAVTALLVMWFILKKTDIGLAIRAVSQDQMGALLTGINTDKVYSITLGVATLLAGLAGILLGPIYYVDPHMGELPMVKAFAIVILGGLGSIKGTIIAAFIISLSEVLVGRYIGALWAPITTFIIMIVILLVKPSGIFGKKIREA